MKNFLLVGFMMLSLTTFGQQRSEGEIFKVVTQMPMFYDSYCYELLEHGTKAGAKKCAKDKMKAHLKSELRYPRVAKDKGIEGIVMVRFIVEKDGNITNVEVVRGISEDCNAEAVRVVSEMPIWEPGFQGSKPVRVQMNLPIEFKL